MKYTLILPIVIFVLALAIFPLIFSIYMSLSKWNPATQHLKFIAFKNFIDMFNDPRFIHAFKLSFAYVGTVICIELVLGIIIANLLQREIAGKNFLRVAYMLPMLLSPVAISYAWKMILDYKRGPLNYFLGWLGIAPIEWLGKGDTAFWSLVMVDVWQWTPFMIFTILAAFESIPEELLEAAVVDGASHARVFFEITLPTALPIIITVILLRTIDAFKVFDTVYILTGGGPGTATETLNFYIYLKGFRAFNLGYGTAMSWFQLIIIIIMFTYFMKFMRKTGAMR
ncbi:sugar ABC transporter permease [Thermatribacter velox]|uniref:Sugar ABC transporter permease n=1 Tax=Thermatribacter velox TaxID=3039681 RepID=A0ABZ2YGY2_9BACT